jgi:chlorite dismutase
MSEKYNCHSYLFFDTELSLKGLTANKLKAAKKSFAAALQKNKKVRIQSYATLAFKPGTRFMLHINGDSAEDIQTFAQEVVHTELGKHLKITYSLFGITRPSQYNPSKAPKEAEWDLKHKYLVVYPFTKTVEWHLKPYEERRNIMWGHVQVGKKHSDKISQRLLYSYGIDDHEFIVSYYMDDLEAFVQLVMDMRETESRRYTKNDLPIFTCIHMPLSEALDVL